jgi:UDP-glucose:glycoprotein glucosyltransferase
LEVDRLLGDASRLPVATLYADITDPDFHSAHKILTKLANEGELAYRVRYKPSISHTQRLLALSGYGVQLALKRTDYIVIDDREDGKQAKLEGGSQSSDAGLETEEIDDVKPLSTSELSRLGLKAASFILKSVDPFDALQTLSRDFPKHSSSISAHEVSDDFLQEHTTNREMYLPSGHNAFWVNGVELDDRQINAFSLLDILRRERKMLKGMQDLGLSSSQAVNVFSSRALAEAKADQEPQRYDWRDDIEGGKVIIWLNNIEKDKRYADWPSALAAVSNIVPFTLAFTYPTLDYATHISRADSIGPKRCSQSYNPTRSYQARRRPTDG